MSCSAPLPVDSQLGLIVMNEVEYLQHVLQSHMDAHRTETDSSGLTRLDESLSDNTDDIRMLLGCETTPAGAGEVPGAVLQRVQRAMEDRTSGTQDGRHSPPARVCLEKRFISVLCQSSNSPGISKHTQIEKWSKPDKMVKTQDTYEGHLFRTAGQQSELVIPAELTWSFRAEKGLESGMRAPFVIYTDSADQQTATALKNEVVDKAVHPIKHSRTRVRSSHIIQGSENWKPCGRLSCTRPLMDRAQRKELHNRKERDRRRRIRLCCDELNLLVPFCYADTDKATTLQWTTAFLKYIQETHGDCLKQDFQRSFCGNTGLRLKPSCVSVAHPLEPCRNITEPESLSSLI